MLSVFHKHYIVMTNYKQALVVHTLKDWNIEKGTARKIFLALNEEETLADSLNLPQLYTYLDLAESLSILASDQEVSLITTTGARREVKINNKDMLLSLIMEWLDYEYFYEENDEGKDNTGLPFDPEREDELQERIHYLIDEGRQWQEVFDALAGRNRSGGWVPLLGYISERLDSILVEDKVEFKNKSEKYTLIFDLIFIFHDRAEDTNNKKAKAVKNWIASYDNLPQGVKDKMQEWFGEGKVCAYKERMGIVYESFFNSLWDNQE